MIGLHVAGEMCGDCTVPYEVSMDRAYTVDEFIREVASERQNFGTIRVTNDPEMAWVGKSLCDYRHGKVGPYPSEMGEMTVVKATARGGWSMYDFTLVTA